MNNPDKALYGKETSNAIENFPVSGISMPKLFIQSLGMLKSACGQSNSDLGLLDIPRSDAIVKAANKIAQGEYYQHFPVDVFQTGSGTSTNMNGNEVISNLASQQSGLDVHPNDHVNMGQSSNDVIPSCIHISAALALKHSLLPSLAKLSASIELQIGKHHSTIKTGRTHLMDAMPLTFAQELSGWKAQINDNTQRIHNVISRLTHLAIGGTAVGTGVNSSSAFAQKVCAHLSQRTGIGFSPSTNYFASLSSQDTAVELSGVLKTLAVSLMKISNDLRWMNSGPIAGLGEIQLQKLQAGSSIMPGKVNPVIPESVAMLCAQVMGNDTAITVAGQSGNFQLNVMLPVIAHNILQSIELLANGAGLLASKSIDGMQVNSQHLADLVAQNPILVTGLNNRIGYEKGAEIAQTAYKQKRTLLEVALEMTDLNEQELRQLLDPMALTSVK